MFGRHLTYTERVLLRRKRTRLLLLSLLIIMGISTVHAFFSASYTISRDARALGFEKGERVLGTAFLFGPDTVLGKLPAFRRPNLGEAVVVSATPSPFKPASERLIQQVIRFFTLQKTYTTESVSIGRICGVPGQEIALGTGSYRLASDEALVKFVTTDNSTENGTAIIKLSEIRASLFLVYWPIHHMRIP